MKIMRIATIVLVFGLALYVRCEEADSNKEEGSILECILDGNTVGCMRTRLARDIDKIEAEVTGKRSEPPMSAVLEQTGNFIAEVIDDIQEPEKAEEEEQADDKGIGEARRKKFGKKKKKHLQRLLGLVMLFKAKIGLLLQLISTHFQLKFFIIAIINLVMNATKFWLDLKKSHPSKVIYYEHAQHQHHYDHDDHDHGYWGRSSNEAQDLAYKAYAPGA